MLFVVYVGHQFLLKNNKLTKCEWETHFYVIDNRKDLLKYFCYDYLNEHNVHFDKIEIINEDENIFIEIEDIT